MSDYAVRPIRKPLSATIRPPGSKSLTNRTLVTAALADGTSLIRNALLSDDTQYMVSCLTELGIRVEVGDNDRPTKVFGCKGLIPQVSANLFCGNAGTVMRFLTAVCCLGGGRFRLDGVGRMRNRPISQLIDALRSMGAGFAFEDIEGYPPFTIMASGLRGGTVSFDSPESSQMVSAMLMAAPYARSDVLIAVDGALVSQPYVKMTLAVMERFGVNAIEQDMTRFIVPAPQRYAGTDYTVEPDASNATYFLAAAAIAGGTVTIEGLGRASVQGDIGFGPLLERMGCRCELSESRLTLHGPPAGTKLSGIDIDLNDMPDAAQTLAVAALFAGGPTRIRNVANLRVKETDRLAALATELDALGAEVEMHDDGLTIHPPPEITPGRINTYDDHRMAMSFALAGLVADGVVIRNAECVAKTYPGFFDDLERACAASR